MGDETEEEKKRFSKVKDMYKPLTDWWKESLTELTEKGAMKDAGVKVEKVEISKRLTESPVVVVTSQFGYSAQEELGDQSEPPCRRRPPQQSKGRQGGPGCEGHR